MPYYRKILSCPWGALWGCSHFFLARGPRHTVRGQLQKRLGLADAQSQKLAREVFVHLGESFAEWLLLSRWRKNFAPHVDVDLTTLAAITSDLLAGQGLVLATGHIGNWELFAQYLAAQGFRVNTIARATFDPRLTDLLKAWRRGAGVVTLNRGDPDTLREMLRIFKRGEGLGILMDVDTAVASVFVPFLGQLAKTPRSAADLSLRSGAPLWFGYSQRISSGRHRLTLRKIDVATQGDREADAIRISQALNAEIEAAIRQRPAQWIWTHKRWKTAPPSPKQTGNAAVSPLSSAAAVVVATSASVDPSEP